MTSYIIFVVAIDQVHDAKLQEGFVTLWVWSCISQDQCPWTSMERDQNFCFVVGIMSGY